MENSDEFFTLTCICGREFCPTESQKCPVCQEMQIKDMKFNVDGFLDKIYVLSEENRKDAALDVVFDAFANFWDKYEMMDEVLAKADVNRLTSTLLVGFMTQTFKYIKQVPSHIGFCDRAAQRLKDLGKSEEEVHDLVDRYRETGDYWKNMKALGATGLMWGPTPPGEN